MHCDSLIGLGVFLLPFCNCYLQHSSNVCVVHLNSPCSANHSLGFYSNSQQLTHDFTACDGVPSHHNPF